MTAVDDQRWVVVFDGAFRDRKAESSPLAAGGVQAWIRLATPSTIRPPLPKE